MNDGVADGVCVTDAVAVVVVVGVELDVLLKLFVLVGVRVLLGVGEFEYVLRSGAPHATRLMMKDANSVT